MFWLGGTVIFNMDQQDQNNPELSTDPISILGLDRQNLEASVHDLLTSSHSKEALHLTGDAAGLLGIN
jgi:hypothetical protein